MDYNNFCFTDGMGQSGAWFFEKHGYNTERANWCKARLEEIQKKGI